MPDAAPVMTAILPPRSNAPGRRRSAPPSESMLMRHRLSRTRSGGTGKTARRAPKEAIPRHSGWLAELALLTTGRGRHERARHADVIGGAAALRDRGEDAEVEAAAEALAGVGDG